MRSCDHTHLGFGRDKRLQHFTHSSIVSLQVLQGGWGEVMSPRGLGGGHEGWGEVMSPRGLGRGHEGWGEVMSPRGLGGGHEPRSHGMATLHSNTTACVQTLKVPRD